MDSLEDIADFRSARFAPLLPDERQVNPERYGAELAYWLMSELARRGVVTSYPASEDWGWYIDYRSDAGSDFAVHCSNIGEASDEWRLSLRRFGRKSFGRDKPPFRDALPLVSAIRDLLETESTVSGLEWLFPESSEH